MKIRVIGENWLGRYVGVGVGRVCWWLEVRLMLGFVV